MVMNPIQGPCDQKMSLSLLQQRCGMMFGLRLSVFDFHACFNCAVGFGLLISRHVRFLFDRSTLSLHSHVVVVAVASLNSYIKYLPS